MLFLRRAHCPFIKKYIKKLQKKIQKKQQRCEHRIRKNKQIKSTVHDANFKKGKKQGYTMKIKSICRNQWQKKEALYKQTALVKAANSIK